VTWKKTDGTTTLASAGFAYVADSTGDHRGQVASVTDSVLGVVAATYDGLGRLTKQTLPSGLSQPFDVDPTGDAVATTWSDSAGSVFVSDAQLSDVHGRGRTETVGGADAGWSSRSYAYDGASRLVGVKESRTAGGCLSRVYGWDLNGNRTSASTYPADAAGACSTSTTAIRSTAPVFDAADRMLASGVAAGTGYDAWGRITTLPAGLTSTPVAGDAGASYYANDLVRSVSQLVLDAEGAPTTTSGVRTWTLDPAGRLATMTSTGLGATALSNHYSDPTGDSPTWTVDTAADGTVTTRRYLSGPAGYLGEATTTAGSTTTSIGLAGLHGDILRTTTPTATGSPDGPALDVDEFGLITNPDTATTGTGPRYGWLGRHQRATDTGTLGLTLMGVRLYTPTLGRFLTTDPVYGGNPNTYAYPTDPVNGFDLSGKCWGWGCEAIGGLARRAWDNQIVRGLIVGAAVVGLCGATAGIGCAIAVGIVAGAAVESAHYLSTNRQRDWSWKNLALRAGRGALSGAFRGASAHFLSRWAFSRGLDAGVLRGRSVLPRSAWSPGRVAWQWIRSR
jgi:RHS repeat-associated protein